MKKQERRKEKGITLIALIITVVVLIILAGIGIGALVNQDGIVDKANEAKLETEKKDIEEQINIMTIQSMDKYGNVIRETLKTKLEDLPEGKEIVDGGNYIGVIYPEYEFYIELGSGKISGIKPPIVVVTPTPEPTPPLVYVGDVPIPSEYTASQISTEDSESEGLVIYEIPEGATVNWTDNEDGDGKNQSTITLPGETEVKNLQETVNQYVWIPVDINDMVMCRSNSGTSVCDLLYDEEENTLTCQTHQNTASDLVGRLYTSSRTGSNPFSYIMDFAKRDQTYNTDDYLEPAVVTGSGSSYDGSSSNLEDAGMPEGSTAQQFLTQLQSDFTAMAKSVAKNGGFYISRYEVGEGGSSKKSQKVLIAYDLDGSNYLGATNWYGLYNTIRDINSNKQMIWGCQYDQVIKFLKENGEDPETAHTDRNLTKSRALSGQNELDCMKNIYDLEGNHREWTAEAYSAGNRVSRGASFYNSDNGFVYPASYRFYGSTDSTDLNSSSRATLYL